MLYQYGNTDGDIKPVRGKPPIKKSREREQSDFQKEILKKNYTTTVKPKEIEEKENIKYDAPIKQETVIATTASQQQQQK